MKKRKKKTKKDEKKEKKMVKIRAESTDNLNASLKFHTDFKLHKVSYRLSYSLPFFLCIIIT